MSENNGLFKLLTPRAEQVFSLAAREAVAAGADEVGCEHVLLGILSVKQGTAYACLEAAGVTYEKVLAKIEKNDVEASDIKSIGLSEQTRLMLNYAAREARTIHYPYVGVEQLLLGMLFMDEGLIPEILAELDVDRFSLRNEILKGLDKAYLPPSPQDMLNMLNGNEPDEKQSDDDSDDDASAQKRFREETVMARQDGQGENRGSALKAYGRDLTELATQGKLDPVIGRAKEIERIMQILCRRTKNNAVLIGEAGVGKTAIVEGLAQAIANGTVPSLLQDKKVVALDLTMLVAGTKYRGQFEERIKNLLEEVRRSKKVILFMDELHTIVNAGNSDGGLDVSNILKPALARGEVQCIGATTMKEYRKSIEKDAALERRFQPLVVVQPSAEDAFAILRGLSPKYEQHHNVIYSDEVLRTAIELSEKYLPSRFLPDKVIDVMDEAGARLHIKQSPADAELVKMERRLDEVSRKKGDALAERNFALSKRYFDEERELKEKVAEYKKENVQVTEADRVTVEDVREVISNMSGVPLTRMAEDETSRLLRMEEELGKIVIGQQEAVHSVSRALRRARAELKDPRRPIGSFIFLGPTGVGKTLLAKALAEFMFGDPDALIRVDMSEYMEKHSVSRMIGTAPGYVGYDDGGQLTERIKRRPYSVVLFDEIEKAHQDVNSIMLQIMEEGQLTDGNGVQVSFRNAIIVYTSNLGAERLGRGQSLGFASDSANRSAMDSEKARNSILDSAKNYFRPEFLNRLDDMIVFRSLEKDDFVRIIQMEIEKVSKLVEARKGTLELDAAVTDLILETGGSNEYGARLFRRQVERLIEDPLADAILRSHVTGVFRAVGHLGDDKKSVVFDIVSDEKDKKLENVAE